MYDQLIDIDEQGLLVPDLAASWDVSTDGTAYTFHLQPNAKFSDGSPLTADDAQYSIQRAAASELLKAQFSGMKSIDVVDPQTIKISLAEPSRVFLNALARTGQTVVLSKKAVEGDPNYFTKPTATSGPWVLKELIPKDHLTLEANPNYWKTGFPKIPTISYTFCEDPTSCAAALESGTADMYYPMAPTDAIRLKNAGKINYFEARNPGTLAWGLDRSKPPFSDLNVRQAVSYMVPRLDRQQTCWEGTGGLSYGETILKGSWAYTPGLEKYNVPADKALETASSLLDSAGWVAGPDGVRVSKGVTGTPDGTKLAVTVPFENNWAQASCNTQLLKNDLAPLGVDITPRAYDPAAFYVDAAANKFQMFHTGAGDATIDDMMLNWFTVAGSLNTYDCKLTDTRYDSIVKQARATSDLEQAKMLYAEVQQMILDDAPCITTGAQYAVQATGLNVHGFYSRSDISIRSLISATVGP